MEVTEDSAVRDFLEILEVGLSCMTSVGSFQLRMYES